MFYVYKGIKSRSPALQACATFWDPMDCSLPGSSVHGILRARILVWVAISFSRGSSQPRDRTWVSCIVGRFFTIWATKESLIYIPYIYLFHPFFDGIYIYTHIYIYSSQLRDRTQVSHIASRFFTIWATRKVHRYYINMHFLIVYTPEPLVSF